MCIRDRCVCVCHSTFNCKFDVLKFDIDEVKMKCESSFNELKEMLNDMKYLPVKTESEDYFDNEISWKDDFNNIFLYILIQISNIIVKEME